MIGRPSGRSPGVHRVEEDLDLAVQRRAHLMWAPGQGTVARRPTHGRPTLMRTLLSVVLLVVLIPGASVIPAAAAPEGQVTWGVHISLAPSWFDPAETPGIVTPFMVLYGLHDAMVK